MIRLFTGYDRRESVGWHVFVQSVLDRATRPVAITRLDACGMPHGTNAFTLSRFLVPYFCGFKGHAIFADASDMLCLADIAELDDLFDSRKAVQVVQHSYMTRNPIKYIGTPMECENHDYPRKNWASLMIVNCEHPAWQMVTPQFVQRCDPLYMLSLVHINREHIGELPMQWNRLVDEGQPLNDANIAHWTAGIPAFEHYANATGAYLWHQELSKVL